MSSTNPVIAREWLEKASEDSRSLPAVLKDGSPSTACFLAQQVVEKCLKALIVYYKHPLTKIHDVAALTNLVQKYEPEIAELQEEIKIVARYYIDTRYPGDYPEFTLLMAQQAVAVAHHVEQFAQKKIGTP